MLITQYILNIDFQALKYVGSGTILVYGSAPSAQIFYGNYSQQFFVGEYVYDQNHTVWQITSITGDATNPVYNATANGETKSFSGSELTKFNQASRYFNNQYDNQILSYEETIQKIDSIVPPPDVYNTGEILSDFSVGEFVYDQNHKIWQIVSIVKDVNSIVYNVVSQNQTNSFSYNEIFKLNEEYKFNDQYDAKIISFEETIQKIDSITPPPDVYNEGKVIPKFQVGEYVIDITNIIWIVLNIENDVTNIFYTIYNQNGAKIVAENDLYKLNEAYKIMGVVYDQQIEEYQLLLNQINQKIINF